MRSHADGVLHPVPGRPIEGPAPPLVSALGGFLCGYMAGRNSGTNWRTPAGCTAPPDGTRSSRAQPRDAAVLHLAPGHIARLRAACCPAPGPMTVPHALPAALWMTALSHGRPQRRRCRQRELDIIARLCGQSSQ